MEIRAAASGMLRQLLAPVVKLMIELGIDYRTFSDAARRAYIDVAGREYGIRGRPTNSARIALLTGINRRDVARLRAEDERAPMDEHDQSNALARVLSGWHQDARYLQADGRPRALQRGAEVDALLTRYGGDVPATALLKELLRVGAVGVENDEVRPLMRYYMPFELDETSLRRYGSVISDLAFTINHNLLEGQKDATRFEGRAVNPRIARRALAEFRALVDAEGQKFLEQIDNWLTEHEVSDDAPRLRLGVGVYLIATPPDPEDRT